MDEELKIECPYGQFRLSYDGQQFMVTIKQDFSAKKESYEVTVVQIIQQPTLIMPGGAPSGEQHLLTGKFDDWTHALALATEKVAELAAINHVRESKKSLHA